MGDEEQVLTECEEVATEEEKIEIETKLEKVNEEKIVATDEENLNDQQVDALLTELRSGKRLFEVAGIGKFYMRAPSVRDQQEADWESTKVMSRALKDGIPTVEEMEEILSSRGLFKDMEQKLDKLTQKLAQLTISLHEYDKKTDTKAKRKALDIAKEMANIREELTSIRMEKEAYLTNTAQGKAQDVRTAFLISRCVYVVETDTRLWETYDDYLEETRNGLLSSALINFITFSAGVSADFIKEFPETSILNQQIV